MIPRSIVWCSVWLYLTALNHQLTDAAHEHVLSLAVLLIAVGRQTQGAINAYGSPS